MADAYGYHLLRVNSAVFSSQVTPDQMVLLRWILWLLKAKHDIFILGSVFPGAELWMSITNSTNQILCTAHVTGGHSGARALIGFSYLYSPVRNHISFVMRFSPPLECSEQRCLKPIRFLLRNDSTNTSHVFTKNHGWRKWK